MSVRLLNVALGASLGAALLVAPQPGEAAWWNIFDRNKEQRQQPAEPTPAAPLPLQTAPVQPIPAQPAPAQAAPMQPVPMQPAPMQAGPAGAAPVPPADIAMPGGENPAVGMARLENQVRVLTGQVEQLQHQLAELREILLAVQEDNESRLLALEGGAPVDSGALSDLRDRLGQPMDGGGGEIEPPGEGAAASAQEQPMAPPAGPGDPPKPLGTLTLSEPQLRSAVDGVPATPPADPNAPMNIAALGQPPVPGPSASGGAETASLPAGEPPQVAYDRAYGLIVAGDYGPAEEGFRAFLAQHPDSELAADAQYWLGETYFAREDYRKAADAFLVGYRKHPESRKAADSLLKLGLSLSALGEQRAACSTYSELLSKHTTISNALLQRVRAEQARAQC